MKTIEIDDDLYSYLLKKSVRIGETASEIIRREVGHPTAGNGAQRSSLGHPAAASSHGATDDENEISQFLQSPMFRSQRQVVDRFLSLLAWTHGREGERFKIVLNIVGRRRKYFALTDQELHLSGTHTNPKPIPNSAYWVVTNNDTLKKQGIIREVLHGLGYSSGAIRRAESALT